MSDFNYQVSETEANDFKRFANRWDRGRTGKSNTRSKGLLHYQANSAEAALLLPGHECLDVVHGLRSGIFTANTNIIAVERNRPIQEVQLKKLDSLGFSVERGNLTPFLGSIHDLPLVHILGNLGRKVLPYTWWDICGFLSRRDVTWFLANRGCFTRGSRIVTTTAVSVWRYPALHVATHLAGGVSDSVRRRVIAADNDWFHEGITSTQERQVVGAAFSQAQLLQAVFADNVMSVNWSSVYRDGPRAARGRRDGAVPMVTVDVELGEKLTPAASAANRKWLDDVVRISGELDARTATLAYRKLYGKQDGIPFDPWRDQTSIGVEATPVTETALDLED